MFMAMSEEDWERLPCMLGCEDGQLKVSKKFKAGELRAALSRKFEFDHYQPCPIHGVDDNG